MIVHAHAAMLLMHILHSNALVYNKQTKNTRNKRACTMRVYFFLTQDKEKQIA